MDDKAKYTPKIALGISIISVLLVAASLFFTVSQDTRNEAVRNESRIVALEEQLKQYQTLIASLEKETARISKLLKEVKQTQLSSEANERNINDRINSMKISVSSEIKDIDNRIISLNEAINALSARVAQNESSGLIARSERVQLDKQVTQLENRLSDTENTAIRNSADIGWLQRLSEGVSSEVQAKIETLNQAQQKQLINVLRSELLTANLSSSFSEELSIGRVTFATNELNELIERAKNESSEDQGY